MCGLANVALAPAPGMLMLLLLLLLQLLSLSVHKSCEISHFAHFRFVLTSVTYAHMKTIASNKHLFVFSRGEPRRMSPLQLLLLLGQVAVVAGFALGICILTALCDNAVDIDIASKVWPADWGTAVVCGCCCCCCWLLLVACY